jgi:hypothetical protein
MQSVKRITPRTTQLLAQPMQLLLWALRNSMVDLVMFLKRV